MTIYQHIVPVFLSEEWLTLIFGTYDWPWDVVKQFLDFPDYKNFVIGFFSETVGKVLSLIMHNWITK